MNSMGQDFDTIQWDNSFFICVWDLNGKIYRLLLGTITLMSRDSSVCQWGISSWLHPHLHGITLGILMAGG